MLMLGIGLSAQANKAFGYTARSTCFLPVSGDETEAEQTVMSLIQDHRHG
jgi:hypothetical protein